MATDTIRADSDSVNPNPRSKNRARTRTRHPQRAPTYARARYPRACPYPPGRPLDLGSREGATAEGGGDRGRWRGRRRAAGTADGGGEGGGWRARRRWGRCAAAAGEAGTVSGGAAIAGCGGLVGVARTGRRARRRHACREEGDGDALA